MESSNISNDIQEKPIPVATPSAPIILSEPAIEENYEAPAEEFSKDIDDNASVIEDQYDDSPLDIKLDEDDAPLEIEIEDDYKLDIEGEVSQDILPSQAIDESLIDIEEDEDDSFVYKM